MYQSQDRHVRHGWREHGVQLPKHWLLLLLQQNLALPLHLLQLLLQLMADDENMASPVMLWQA